MRKYIFSKEEVIKELKNGKKLYEKDYPQNHYEMIDGIICGQFGKNEPFIINCPMDMDDKFYIEEEKPFQIEVGKFYKTRNGKRVYCYRFEPKNEITKALFGFVVDNGAMFSTDIKGKYYFAPDGKSDLDIVGIWKAER